MLAKEKYREWKQVSLVDPRDASVEQLTDGITKIVTTEGPVMASRVFGVYAKAVGLGRIVEETRQKFATALKAALDRGVFLSEQEDPKDAGTSVLRMPDQKYVRFRSLGARSLHEVPASELAEVMLEIRVEDELISREGLFHRVLKEYGLVRLTGASGERLEHVLEASF